MNCSYCRELISKNLSLKEILSFQTLSSSQLCLTCKIKFERLPDKNSCFGCNRLSQTKYCGDCLKWQKKYPTYYFQHQALFVYNNSMHEWFEEYKFRGNYLLRDSFSEQVRNYFKDKKEFIVVPLPISDKRLAERGFNQVEGILEAAGVNYHSYLVRKKDGKPQAQKTRQERLELEQPFELTDEGKVEVQNQKVLLVDDIYTTGRTIFHGAQVLLESNPQKLRTFSISR